MDYNNPDLHWWPGQRNPLDDMNENDLLKMVCTQIIVYFLIFALAVIVCALLSGCASTQYIERWHTKTDTLRVTQHQRDSLYFCDSIYTIFRHEGDTVFLTTDRWRTHYRERTVHDTVYQAYADTLREVSEHIEEPKPQQHEMSRWQRFRIHLGDTLLTAAAIAVIIWIYRRKRP